MKLITPFVLICILSIVPRIAFAQTDTTKKLVTQDTTTHGAIIADTTGAIKKPPDTTVVAVVPANCYKQWLDYFTELGTKPISDGTHPIVIAFKNKDGCRCFMGKVELVGGKMKAPVYIETEGGEFKTFTALGKKLDPEFLAAQGQELWTITNGMSVLFQTTDQEYGRIFLYKSLNKNKGMNKEAPSPSELLK